MTETAITKNNPSSITRYSSTWTELRPIRARNWTDVKPTVNPCGTAIRRQKGYLELRSPPLRLSVFTSLTSAIVLLSGLGHLLQVAGIRGRDTL